MPGRRRCPPVTGSSARRRLRGNTGAPEPVGGRGRPPGICVGALPSPALCWADRAHSFCEETLIKRLSPQPAPHLVTGCSFALVGQRPRRSLRIPLHPSRLPSLSSHVSSGSPSPAGARDQLALRRAWEGRAPRFSPSPEKHSWWPSHPAGGRLCRQGHQPVLVSAEVARTCPGRPQNFGAVPCARAVRTAAR